MLRTWSDHELVISHFPKVQHLALRLSTQISSNAAPATKSDTPTSPKAAPATKNNAPKSPNVAPAAKNYTATSPNVAPGTKNDSHDWSCSHVKHDLKSAEQQDSYSNIKYCICHTPLLLSCYLNLLYWTVTLLDCYFTELLLYWTVTLLSCYLAELLLNCYFTELLLYWILCIF